MSKNSKMQNKAVVAAQNTETRKAGNKGPKETQKKNKKRNTWFARLAGKVSAAAPSKQEDDDVE